MSAMPLEVSALETGQATLWILLVAVNEYYDRRLPSLQYSVIDCQDLAKAFAQATQKFSTTTVRVHHDAAEFAPTVGAVRKSLAEIVETAQPEDTVLLYFCGHSGLESRFQQAVLCLADTEKDALLKTGLSLMSVLGQLGNCAAKQQILWLDLFHGNGMALQDGVENPLLFDNPAWQLNEMLQRHAIDHSGFSAFLSCDAAQRTKGSQPQQSWKFPELGQSVFAHFLIEGLRGAAANGKGVIDANALEEYVSVQTQKFIDRANDDLRRLHDPDSKREGLLLSPKYLAQSPKRIGQSSTCVLGLKLPDLLESIVPQVKRQDTIDEVIPVPVDSEPEPETLNLKTETPAPEAVPSLEDIALSSLVVNELRDVIESEETIPADSEASPLPHTESRSQASPVVEVEETPVEVPTEPVAEELIVEESIAEELIVEEPVAEESVAEFISEPVVEYGTEETFQQIDTDEGEVSELTSELDEPVAELVFEPVVGIAEDSAQGERASESVAEFVEPIPELISEPVIEYTAADSLTQIEDETDFTSELDESVEPGSELVFEPVIGIVEETSSVESAPELVEPISELISEPVIEYTTADSLTQIQDETGSTAELDESAEPSSELVFESVIGAVTEEEDVSQLERSFELVSEPISESIEAGDSVAELISEPTLESITDDHLDQIDVATEPVSESDSIEPIEPVSELVFESVIGSVEDESHHLEVEPFIAEPIAEQVEPLEPISDLISDPVIEYGTEESSNPVEVTTEPGLDLIPELDESVEPGSELFFEPVVGTVLEDDLDRIESVTEEIDSSVEQPVLEDSSEIITESINLEENQLIHNGTAYQPDLEDQPDLENSEEDDFGLFVDSVHKAVGKSADSPVSQAITESDPGSSTSVADLSKASPAPQLGRSLLENLQRSSRNVTNAGQAIYQDRAPEIQNALTETATRFDRSTRQLTQTTLDGIRQPRTQKIAIAALGGVGIVAIGVTAFSLYQQRNAQLNSIQSLSANSAALLSSNRVTEAVIDALKAGQQLQQLDRPWNFVPDSAKIATVAALQQAIAQSTLQTALPLEAGLRHVTMSADAKTLAAVTSQQTIQLWQREDNQLKPLNIAFDAGEGHQAPITQLQFSPDGKILASASEDKTVKLWNTEKGTLIKTLSGHQDRVTAISFRSDGGVLATASHDRTIKLWGIPSGNVLDTLKGHDAEISVMTFSPDGRVFSAGSTANTIYLWFPDSNKPLLLGRHQATSQGSSAQGISDLAFSADGKTIASASWNDAIKLWTVSDGKSNREASPRQTLKSETNATSLSFSPDGKWLASGRQDGAIQLWDLQTSTAIKTLFGHQGTVQKVAFNSDGKALTSVGDRNGIILWDFNLTTLMKQGCNLAQNEIRSNFTLQNSNLCRSDS